MNFILIIGATSEVAKELALLYAQNGYNLYLAARKSDTLISFSSEIILNYNVRVELLDIDLTNLDSLDEFYHGLTPSPYGVIFVSGYMTDQKICEIDWEETRITISVNFLGPVRLLNTIANSFEHRKKGFIIGISSVAGERGRKSNYIYGSSKAAFSSYLSGLRNRLNASNVHVLTVKPGFIDTKMIEGLELPRILVAKPGHVAKKIFNAQNNMRDVIYTKSIWSIIMFFIRIIPEKVFKNLKL